MEVAEDLSISQAQVSRLEKNAVKQLKKILKQNSISFFYIKINR